MTNAEKKQKNKKQMNDEDFIDHLCGHADG